MNSVTQKGINNTVRRQEEGAATGVALCCCIFLFSTQLFSFLSADSVTVDYNLQASEVHTLRLLSTQDTTGKSEPDIRIAMHEQYRITPFFFQPVPINHSNHALLMTVKGVGPTLAQEIIKTRERMGPFLIPQDLLRVNGIGQARLHQFSPQFSFSRSLETD